MRTLREIRQRMHAGMERTRAGKYAVILAVLLIGSILVETGVELITRGSVHGAYQWIVETPKLFALNASISLLVMVFVYCVIGSLVLSLGVASLLLFAASLVSYFKTKMIGEPFFPWDIFLKKEGMDIAPLVSNASAMKLIAAVIAVVLIVLLMQLVVPRLSLPWVPRIVVGLLSVYALYALGVGANWVGKMYDKAGAGEIVWNQQQNYSNNGMQLAFAMNVKNAIVHKPEGYGEETMASIAQTISSQTQAQSQPALKTASASATASVAGGKQPNVIFIMNEAFWDPSLMTNVTFSEDPAPTVHKLQQEFTSGYLLSPQFGGGTSNVEFEVLTGNSMSFLPGGSVPYQQYVNKPVPSLASYFEDQGYKSMAIHSYEGWFWNRENVYKQLGFESFKSKENFENPKYKGFFISDEEVSKSIIQEVDSTDKPMFIYAVTMQNHGPYDTKRYDDTQIKVDGNLTASGKQILETYTQGVHDADASLNTLIQHFQDSGEPTIIVFYGDHLPMLGYDYQVYAESGFVQSGDASKWTLEEEKKMHSVPFVTWSNFSLPKQDVPTLSDSFLGAHVLDMLQMEKPAQFAYESALAQKVPGLLRDLVVDANQNVSRFVPDELKTEVNQYQQLQYDELFGKQYLANYIDHDYLTKAALSNYNEQFGNQAEGKLNAAGG